MFFYLFFFGTLISDEAHVRILWLLTTVHPSPNCPLLRSRLLTSDRSFQTRSVVLVIRALSLAKIAPFQHGLDELAFLPFHTDCTRYDVLPISPPVGLEIRVAHVLS